MILILLDHMYVLYIEFVKSVLFVTKHGELFKTNFMV